MPEIRKGVLAQLHKVCGKYGDSTVHFEEKARLYVWFHEYLDRELLDAGGVEVGSVFRQRGLMTLLVYKATFDGVQHVVFVTGNNHAGCIRSLCSGFYADTLKWVKDKFA